MGDEPKSAPRLSAAVALLLSLAGIVGTVFSPQGARNYLIAGALLAIAWTVERALVWRRRAEQQRRAIQSTPAQLGGFNGALPYTRHDTERFYGRELDVGGIIGQIRQSGYQLGVLYGPSGVGKTSIIQAGLVPRIEGDCRPCYVDCQQLRHLGEGEHYLKSEDLLSRLAVALSPSRGTATRGTRALPHAVAQVRGTHPGPVVLFLDQFEQVFDLLDGQERETFTRGLAALCTTERSVLKIVLSIRADYFGLLYQYLTIERPYTYFLDKFNDQQARSVIRRSTGLSDRLNEEAPDHPLLSFEDTVIDDLRGMDGRIHPVELSLICWVMQRDQGALTRSAYLGSGGKEGWLERYLDEILHASGNRTQALLVLSSLIEQDKAILRTAAEVVSITASDRAAVEKTLEYLDRAHLLTRESDSQIFRYRLAHEYLIPRIQLRVGSAETPLARMDRQLTARAAAWHADGESGSDLLGWKELYGIYRLGRHIALGPREGAKARFVRRSARRKLLTGSVVGFVIAVGIAAAFVLRTRTVEIAQRAVALESIKYKSPADRGVSDAVARIARLPMAQRERVMQVVLRDTSDLYSSSIVPWVIQAAAGIDPSEQRKVVQLIRRDTSFSTLVRGIHVYYLTDADSIRAAIVRRLISAVDSSTSTETRSQAALALAEIAPESSHLVTVLERRLRQSDSDKEMMEQIALLAALTAQGPRAARTAPLLLQKATAKSEDVVEISFNVRDNALIEALGAVSRPDTAVIHHLTRRLTETLTQDGEDGSSDDVMAAARAVFRIGKNSPSMVLPLLLDSVAPNILGRQDQRSINLGPEQRLSELVALIGKERPDVAVPLILQHATGSVYNVTFCLGVLKEMGPTAGAATGALTAAFQRSGQDHFYREQFAETLGGIGNNAHSAASIIVERMREIQVVPAESQARTHADTVKIIRQHSELEAEATALGQMGVSDPATAALLGTILQNLPEPNESFLLSSAILETLGIMGPSAESVVPILLSIIADPQWMLNTRLRAGSAAVRIDRRTVPTVAALIRAALRGEGADPQTNYIDDVAKTLGAVGIVMPDSAVQVLDSIIRVNPEAVREHSQREEAINALSEVGRTQPMVVGKFLVRLLIDQDSTSELTPNLITAIGKLPATARSELLTLLKRCSDGTWGTSDCASLAQVVLQDTVSPKIAVRVLRDLGENPVIAAEFRDAMLEYAGRAAGKKIAGDSLNFDGSIARMSIWISGDVSTLSRIRQWIGFRAPERNAMESGHSNTASKSGGNNAESARPGAPSYLPTAMSVWHSAA